MKFTVVLQRPDYMSDNYGTDIYVTHVTGNKITGAVAKAKREVAHRDGEPARAEDYAVLLVYKGYLEAEPYQYEV